MPFSPKLFPPTLDTKVAETDIETGFNTSPLLKSLGPDTTWRQVIAAEDRTLAEIPGYGPKTVRSIRRFSSENIPYTCQDFIESL